MNFVAVNTPPGPWRRSCWRVLWLLALAGLLGGCSAMQAMQAQNPPSALKPVNAASDGSDARLMLKGHDVVAYFTQGRHALGQAQFSSVHEAVTFRFASAEHKALFDAAPQKYLPQFGGYCANGIVYAFPGAAMPTPGAWSTASSTSSAARAARTPSNSTCRAT